MATPMPEQPTTKQLYALRALAERTGTTFVPPRTKAEASREITRMKKELDGAGRRARKGTREQKPITSLPYALYLTTSHWKRTRQEALQRADYACEECRGREHLEVHHRTYEWLGRERWRDLLVLCDSCHRDRHRAKA